MQAHIFPVFQKSQEEILLKFRFCETGEPSFGRRVQRVQGNVNLKFKIIAENKKVGKI